MLAPRITSQSHPAGCRRTYPHAQCYRTACQVLDTHDLWRHVAGPLPSRSTHALVGSANRRRGLARLVHAAFGRDLDKRQQCSSWDDRPLSAAQMAYASLDAHVLLQLFGHVTRPEVATDTAWTQWARTFHFYAPDTVLEEAPVPDSLRRSLHADGVVVPEDARYLKAPHALLSMNDAISFLARCELGCVCGCACVCIR